MAPALAEGSGHSFGQPVQASKCTVRPYLTRRIMRTMQQCCTCTVDAPAYVLTAPLCLCCTDLSCARGAAYGTPLVALHAPSGS